MVSHFFSMPSTLKYLYSVEPVRMHFPMKQPCTNDTVCNAACSIAHSNIYTRLFCGKMHSDWFNGIGILQGTWQREEKVGYCYPSGLEKTLCKWDVYVPLVTKGLNSSNYIVPNDRFIKWRKSSLIWTTVSGFPGEINENHKKSSVKLVNLYCKIGTWNLLIQNWGNNCLVAAFSTQCLPQIYQKENHILCW